jgi:hypothetical protein
LDAVFSYGENHVFAQHSVRSPQRFFLSVIQNIKRPEKQTAGQCDQGTNDKQGKGSGYFEQKTVKKETHHQTETIGDGIVYRLA